MAEYNLAFNYMMDNEDRERKGEVSIDSDGGKVRFGLNAKSHPELLAKGYYEMPTAEALNFASIIYSVWYWGPVHGQVIFDQDIANRVFDRAVNSGVKNAGRILQRAANNVMAEMKNPPHAVLDVDGIIGPQTIFTVNRLDSAKLLEQWRKSNETFVTEVCDQHPELAKYRNGLLIRARA